MKNNAKEYLFEYAKTVENDWEKALIYNTVKTNGELPEQDIDNIYNTLQNDVAIKYTVPTISDSNDDSELYLKELRHKSGVSALCNNQTIKFHKDVTILYGLNGVGKSSYFKILNEITGGNQEKVIISNIHQNITPLIDVEVVYSQNQQDQTIQWNNTSRSIDPLNKCKVFDTSYLDGLLNVREADITLVEPLGLHLFSSIINTIDELKRKLTFSADEVNRKKPNINETHLRESLKSVFLNHKITLEDKSIIEDLFNFTEENSKQLTTLQKQLQELNQKNINDRIQLLSQEQQSLESIKNKLTNTSEYFTKIIPEIKQLIVNQSEKLQESLKAQEQYQALQVIPSRDSEEWKNFIMAGEEYKNIITDNSEHCPYCLQSIESEQSLKIVEAYTLFLKDKSEQALQNANTLLEKKRKEIELKSVELLSDTNIPKILKQNYRDDVSLLNAIKTIDESFKALRVEIINTIDNKQSDDINIPKTITPLINELEKQVTSIKENIVKLKAENDEKEKRINSLKSSIIPLQENQSISQQKDKIEQWIALTEQEDKLRLKASKIKTSKLSNLSKMAHENLLTEQLKTYFNIELDKITNSKLGVSLENNKARKGVTSTKLVLTKNNQVTSILSEGEQKAVALALFIAEVKVQKSINPIILDDPVNSLDHQIAGSFGESLLSLPNQIIIFSHNRLFLDAFECSKDNHICKTVDTDCNKSKGRHIRVYEVISQGKNQKGILKNYKENRAENHIKEANRLLRQQPFDESLKVSSLIRLSVECCIDEVILQNNIPTKFSNKNSRINWGNLKKLGGHEENIEKLHQIHSRVSGGSLHNGTERTENSIEVEEFEEMTTDIENILAQSIDN